MEGCEWGEEWDMRWRLKEDLGEEVVSIQRNVKTYKEDALVD